MRMNGLLRYEVPRTDSPALHTKIAGSDESCSQQTSDARVMYKPLGDWSLNLLHTRPKLVVAVCEHGRLGIVLAAAPYTTLPQRFVEAVNNQLLIIGVPPTLAKLECEAMLPLTIMPTTPYASRLSLQANLKDYVWLAETYRAESKNSLTVINERLAESIVGINGKLGYPSEFVLKLLLA